MKPMDVEQERAQPPAEPPGGASGVPNARRWLTGRRLAGVALLLVAVGALALAAAERAGWPFLAAPAQRLLADKLQRTVVLGAEGAPDWHLNLIGGLRLQTSQLSVGNAPWAGDEPLLDARGIDMRTRWRDVLAWRPGTPLQLQQLSVDELRLNLQRRADGQANWRFGESPAPAAQDDELPPAPVKVDALRVDQGHFQFTDAVNELSAQGNMAARPPTAGAAGGWSAEATGHYRQHPLRAQAQAGTALSDMLQGDAPGSVPVKIALSAGAARLRFEGTVKNVADPVWDGDFDVAGASLAAVGRPMGLTLPTTPAFSMSGHLKLAQGRAVAAVKRARIGRSELAGDFVYDSAAQPRPRLSGEVRGRALWLQDLGPAVGTTGPADARPVAASAEPAGERVLPARRFDLPSLSRMDADVRMRLDRLELGHPQLRSFSPLNAQLSLKDGVLVIDDIDARATQGTIRGQVLLDGRSDPALWKVDLTTRGLQLDRWIVQRRAASAPPYVSGRLAGRVQLEGRGRSVAELLAGSNGQAWLVLSQGRVSHLAVEAAGIDVAQALGVALRGDDALDIGCGAAELAIRAGRVHPKVLLVDTRDSTLWVEGWLSFIDERLDLLLRVEPKDFSPLSLRAPLKVNGTLASPTVSVEPAPLMQRVIPAALLAMLHPLAALLPMLDAGDDEAAAAAVAACRKVVALRQPKATL